jgi:type 1 fimbria pilin
MRQLNSKIKGKYTSKAFLLSVFTLTTLGWGHVANACDYNGGGNYGPATNMLYDAYAPAASQYGLTPISVVIPVPLNPTANQVLMTMTRPLASLSGAAQGQATPYGRCNNSRVEKFDGFGAPNGNVYPTSVAGIGYRVTYYMQSGDAGSAVYAPWSQQNPYASGVMFYPFSGSSAGSSVETMIELVATGDPIIPGTITSANVYGQTTLAGFTSALLYRVYMTQDVVVANPTCTTDLPTLVLNLPDVSTTTLLRDGEGPKKDLTFGVTCNVPNTISPVITVTSSNLVAGTQNTLANVSTATNKAEGVGVELWLGSPTPGGAYTAPTLGIAAPNFGTPTSALPSATWDFTVAANLKMTATTASDVRAGPVQSTATLTFTYN